MAACTSASSLKEERDRIVAQAAAAIERSRKTLERTRPIPLRQPPPAGMRAKILPSQRLSLEPDDFVDVAVKMLAASAREAGFDPTDTAVRLLKAASANLAAELGHPTESQDQPRPSIH